MTLQEMTPENIEKLRQELEDYKHAFQVLREVCQSSADYCDFCSEAMLKALRKAEGDDA